MMDDHFVIQDINPKTSDKYSAFELMDRTSQMNDFLYCSVLGHEALDDVMAEKLDQVTDLLGEVYQLAAQQFIELAEDEQ